MPRGGAHFSSRELAEVLSRYDLGAIRQVKSLSAGNKRSPKMVVISERGKFLLKRRPKGKDDLYRVAFAHAVQTHLAKKAFPVTSLRATCDENNTILQLNNHIYELFKFVSGARYDGSAEATIDAGRQLAKFHQHLADFACQWKPLRGSFHDSTTVRRYLKAIGTDDSDAAGRDLLPHLAQGKNTGSKKKLQKTAEMLMDLYNSSTIRVNQLGFDSWPEQVVHGDWHPGNMLFSDRKLSAVLDFDSVRIAPKATDLANGMLQFSIVGDRPNPADWPAYLDQAKLVQFLSGYREVIELSSNEVDSLLDLMIETIIAEAVLPIATTGFFGNLSGGEFLNMIQRKADWIDKNRDTLTEATQG